MVEFLTKLWKDEDGFFGFVGNLLAASGIKDALEGDEDTFDPYNDLRTQYQGYISKKLGKSTPYSYNSNFEIEQPEVEKNAESKINQYLLGDKSNVGDYEAATKKYSDATKASMRESYESEMADTKDMYNRLGLVSSTPGLNAQGDVLESQRIAENLFDSELMYKNLDRQLQAQGLDVTELNNMLSQASGLGQTQRSSQQYTQQMSMQDLIRQVEEEQNWASMLNSLLGSNPPQVSYTPGLGQILLQSAASAAPYALMAASDRRLKKNIKWTGLVIRGLKLYTWKWKAWVSDKIKKSPSIGFIAQEVQKLYPEAVKEIDGYLHIQYSAI